MLKANMTMTVFPSVNDVKRRCQVSKYKMSHFVNDSSIKCDESLHPSQCNGINFKVISIYISCKNKGHFFLFNQLNFLNGLVHLPYLELWVSQD